MRRSIKNGLFFGLLFGLFLELFAWLFAGQLSWLLASLLDRPPSALLAGLLVGLSTGVLVGLRTGLFPAILHYILRFWLGRTHLFPWKAVPFLNDATTRILLRRVGGGYSFTHRLLLDHLADTMENNTPASSAAQVTAPQKPVSR